MIDKRVLDVIDHAATNNGTPRAVVKAVVARLLPSIRLVAHPADGEMPLGASRVGGCPDLPKGTHWPRRSDAAGEDPADWDPNDPFRFVMQVNLAEAKPFDVAGVLPKSGLLSFFYVRDPDDWPGDVAFIVMSKPTNLCRLSWPDDLHANRRYRPLALTPCVEWTVQSIEDSGFTSEQVHSGFSHFDFFEEIEQLVAQAQGMDTLNENDAPKHRLLGHPQLIHSPGLADGTRLLLQVDSDPAEFRGPDLPRTGMTWGDCGRIFYLSSDDELKSHRLAEKPWVLWEG